MTFFEFSQRFPTEEAAINYFYTVRYHGVLTCPHCFSKIKLYRTARQKVCICHYCENTFSPFGDTIFRKSKTDMRKWFYAVHLVLNAKKGISACNLQREIGTTYRTAWRMLHQIRLAMGNVNMYKAFECFVEIDETYIGGKPRKSNVTIDNNGKVISKKQAGEGGNEFNSGNGQNGNPGDDGWFGSAGAPGTGGAGHSFEVIKKLDSDRGGKGIVKIIKPKEVKIDQTASTPTSGDITSSVTMMQNPQFREIFNDYNARLAPFNYNKDIEDILYVENSSAGHLKSGYLIIQCTGYT